MKISFNKFEEMFFYGVSAGAALIACLLLFMILAEIGIRAIPSLTWYFISTPESMTPHIGMGIANAIWGSVIIALLATLLAIPLSLGTAIYLQRYAAEGRITRAFRFFIEVLSGTPSIVIGIFGLLVLVYYLRPFTGGFSLLSGSIALAILIVPVIERSIENAISSVPFDLEEGSYALGATKWQTIRLITLPTAVSGIITGAILGFGRAAEESAVVILTAGYSQFMPEFAIKPNPNLIFGIKLYPIQDLVGTLPYSVYHAYENSNVIPVSNGFAAAVILISVVLLINLLAKIIITRIMPGRGSKGGSKGTFPAIIATIIARFRITETPNPDDSIKQLNLNAPLRNCTFTECSAPELVVPHNPSLAEIPRSMPPMKWNHSFASRFMKKQNPVQTSPDMIGRKNLTEYQKIHLFLRTLLPFAIPAALLLLIAFLAGFPPLHSVLGPARPSLAGLFAKGLAFIVVVVGTISGLILGRKAGTLQGKTSRAGGFGVAAGVCLLLVAGIICSSAASGLFNTGGLPLAKNATDRAAQLAALVASEEMNAGTSLVKTAVASSSASSQQGRLVNTSGGVVIPVKDALSIGESYQYGDATRACEVKVYDYKVLPFYFWWFIDYNRFVYQIPSGGDSYLVVFIRIEDTGSNSAIVPSADLIQVINNGNSYEHKPYFNMSALSAYQIQYYSTHFDKLPYQWIRELGQDKRDYAFLTGYNILNGLSNTTITGTVTGNPSATDSAATTTVSDSTNNGKGFFIKPGASNAIDGYLIFEVPDNVVKKDIDKTYVGISFNANSGTRWRLETTPG